MTRFKLAPALASPPHLAFFTTRVLLIVACYICLELFPVHTIEPWQGHAFPGNNWLDGWVRWDSMWYESIIDANARLLPKNYSSANFFPMYSWMAWVVSLPLRPFLGMERAFYIGGLALSHAAFLGGLIGVFQVASRVAGREVATRTVWLIAIFPFSFFFSAVYSDALYFCLAVWCFHFASAGRWRLASTLALLAAVTRLHGFALFPALAVEYLAQHDFRLRSLRLEVGAVAILALSPAVIAIYFWARYGSPIEFVHARQAGWHRATGLAALTTDWREFTAGSLFGCTFKECFAGWDFTRTLLGYWYISLVPICVTLIVYAARTIGAGPSVWVLTSLVMALANGLDGMGRFAAVLFPVFIAFAMLVRNRVAFLAVCASCVPFLFLFLFQFARWRPVL